MDQQNRVKNIHHGVKTGEGVRNVLAAMQNVSKTRMAIVKWLLGRLLTCKNIRIYREHYIKEQ